jgi:hypothetical protein
MFKGGPRFLLFGNVCVPYDWLGRRAFAAIGAYS